LSTSAIGFGTLCWTARSSAAMNSRSGATGTLRTEAPAMMKPKGWIG
jgi:hypothetical protein